MPLHRHLEHDELFWPLDHAITLAGAAGGLEVQPGQVARMPRGVPHGSAAPSAAHVLLVSRGERSLQLNGHYDSLDVEPPTLVDPMAGLAERPANTPHFLLPCDHLHLYVERVRGSGPTRQAAQDVLVAPLGSRIGLRCGGMVVVVGEWEMARVPRGSGWHLFGQGQTLWFTIGEAS